MSFQLYNDELKNEAVRQVADHGRSVSEVAQRLGVSARSLYAWLRERGVSRRSLPAMNIVRENAHLRAELLRVTEERDFFRKATIQLSKLGAK